ncbi:MAG: 3-phosphoshikimate 1-carboxyvinyltransferase [Chloroflexi bacterium]|nr:3-phosphoshikimate 1-carboxyvinyltransferase [Chloroflexota bacterium]MBL7062329.1 3-phosphoshikimate 1-carboxyvinyltransferase [Dehalococcoidia bacterium]
MAEKALLRRISPPKQLVGEVAVPGDKSISHRALILNSLALGNSKISNISPGRDCQSTINCLRALGVRFTRQEGKPTAILVHGVGNAGLTEAKNILNAGNSATTMRLLSGVLAVQPFLSIFTGDISLRSRPMRRLIEPLRLMGAEIYGRGEDSLAPLVIKGKRLYGVSYSLPVPSAQIKSAILLAGLFADGSTAIEEPQHSRDHTERLLKRMGAELVSDNSRIVLTSLTDPLTSIDLCVPGDISSAAYWLVAGAIHPNARIKIVNCGVNPTRTGIIDALLAMGAKLKIENQRLEGNEPLADLYVESSRLKAIEISGDIIPRLIDEIPLLAVAACVAQGDTLIKGAGELRVKESDRIKATARELSRLGANIEESSDGMVIHGGRLLLGAEVRSHFDHRLAMTLAVAGLVARGSTLIHNARVAEISYPGFWEEMEKLAGY